MNTRTHLNEPTTTGDRFPAPTRAVNIFFTSGAADCLPAESMGNRRFMVVEAPKPKRRAYSGCPIQVDGPYYTRARHQLSRPLASALLIALVTAALRGG